MYVWGCGGGWEKRKINRSCVKFDSFSSQGFVLTNFSFSSCRFPSFGEKLWLSGWKKLNGAETTLFDVLSDWVGEKTDGKVAPDSFQFLPQKLAPGSPPEFCDSWCLSFQADSSWIVNLKSHIFSWPWRPIPWARAQPGRAEPTLKDPSAPKCHPVDLSGIPPWGCMNLGGLITEFLMQTLIISKQILTFALLLQNYIIAPSWLSQPTCLVGTRSSITNPVP